MEQQPILLSQNLVSPFLEANYPALTNESIWTDPRLIPAYLSTISLFLLILHAIIPETRLRRYYAFFVDVSYRVKELQDPVYKESIAWSILQSVRIIASLALLAIQPVLINQNFNVINLTLLAFFAYTALLSPVPIFGTSKWKYLVSSHLSFLHLIILFIYVLRDIAPVAAGRLPLDYQEGALGWTRFAVLILTGFFVPANLPRRYIPADPENPIPPTITQTASYLSLAFFSHLDPLIYKAFKNSTLTIDDLPTLADDDTAGYIEKSGFKTLDPVQLGRKQWSFIWATILYFKKQYAVMSALSIVQAINEFASPVAINRILSYLEGDHDALRPWVWIVWLTVGPIINSICQQTYLYFSTKIVIRRSAIITHLVFVHSLRVRLSTTVKKEDAPSSKKTKKAPAAPLGAIQSPAPTPVESQAIDAADAAHVTGVPVEMMDGADPAGTAPSSVAATDVAVKAAETNKPKEEFRVEEKKPEEKSQDQIGKITNMISSDLRILQGGADWLTPVFLVVRLGICIALLYIILGWSAFVGMAIFICMIPVPGWLAKLGMKLQATKMKKSDARIAAINQVMNVLRMIKIFAWEDKVEKHLSEKREEELGYILKTQWLSTGTWMLNSIFPLMTMIATYATYTLILKKSLTASTIYSSIAVFNIFQEHLFGLFHYLPNMLRAIVSLNRVGDFVNNGELYSESGKEALVSTGAGEESSGIKICKSAFTWEKQSDSATGAQTPSTGRRNFKLQIDGDLVFKHGELNIICGPTGSGKTSMLMALLGEMYYQPLGPDSQWSLPREQGVAYAAQESWVLNETIRDNILFGAKYDKERFDKVIYQCALTRDLSLFEAGDLTEVGEKGITLSGGQKARLTLARAVYSSAQTLLLDDVLSALDVHTARWVADKCLGGDLLRGRTTILVTHNVLLVEPYAAYVISLSVDGRIVSQGTVAEALKKNDRLRAEIELEEAQARKEGYLGEDHKESVASDEDKDASKAAGKLIVPEEMAQGHLSWRAMKMWLVEFGGPFFFTLCLVGIFADSVMSIAAKWFLGYWAMQYDAIDHAEVPVPKYLAIYAGILVAGLIFVGFANGYWAWGSVRASRALHRKLVHSILTSTFRWLDTTPISRVLSRCSQDCQMIDGPLAEMSIGFLYITSGLICTIIAVITQAGLTALISAFVVVALGMLSGQLYMAAQLPVKRDMSNARSPVLSHVGAALNGLVSIRAYGAQAAFHDESLRRIDRYTRAARVYWNLNRWIGVRMDTLGGLFTGIVAAYVVYGRPTTSGNVGFTLALMSGFSFELLVWIRLFNEVEVQGNSLERIQDFLDIDHEPPSTKDASPPAYWPASGELVVENLSAKYSLDGSEVLKNINFVLKSGERMGIVGRTGAGKSTVALALLRAIPTTGTVLYDGLDTDKINLSALRSNVTVIPQHPELLAGTLRENLDPFGDHDDALLNEVLNAAGLNRTQTSNATAGPSTGAPQRANVGEAPVDNAGKSGESGTIGLDTEVASGGSNFSQGQRQIIALARAILRRSRVVILDEATAAIDYETDRVIQESLKTEFKDATVITVAHRLQTIMGSDKILVLDAGEIKELDSPKALLKRQGSFFKGLVDESSDKEALYSAAGL
ncbi:P-loop containing nucleoside triphosphate hydrolase protein [Sistotremastrum suecicum HHB10207 ss-3]|uniref:p-loop containing nucleoside triphosphate hydrolase protein n=1 Tax=Sistotremastrum suecicum HHB10207 ss-3 TaxID=1314776 RepID=A0A166H3V6_9AGAM|nr:P-loop containing nucleoside triphosphate hydrolase protein [Sistotremastrum suecicum HHB10207 ss-3]